jgi:hypothetical protein
MARPKKIKGPFRLDEFLRIALRKKRPEDRWQIFRAWRRYYLKSHLNREPTDGEHEAEIKKWQEHEFRDWHETGNLMFSLQDFVAEYHKENRIQRARRRARKMGQRTSGHKKIHLTEIFIRHFCIKHLKTRLKHPLICAKHRIILTEQCKTGGKHGGTVHAVI